MNWFQKIFQALGLASYSPDTPTFIPVVTVKILDSLALSMNQGDTLTLSQLVAKVGASMADTPVANIASAYASATFARMLEPVSPADVQAFVTAAQAHDPTYEPPNLNNFLEIVCPPGFDTAALALALQAWTGVVEYAGRNPDPTGAAGTLDTTWTRNPLSSGQIYIPGATGVNAVAAWTKGADGTGVSIVDLEQGWFLQHQDLPAGVSVQVGVNAGEIAHGTRVLGILVAQDNTKGVIGLAPKVHISLASVMDAGASANTYISRAAQRIFIAGTGIPQGDVLLLEQGLEYHAPSGRTLQLPLEASFPIFSVIRAVVAHGTVVVEAAGNGGANLALFADDNGKHVLDRGVPSEFKDSGAIMVAGGSPDKSPTRTSFTNYGNRIDCCAHGDLVVTCDYDPGDTSKKGLYTTGGSGPNDRPYFSGTSPAAAIIAGCCVLIQHLQSLLTPKTTSGKLTPAQMRALLSKAGNCSAPGNASDMIAAMPDLGLIVTNEYMP